MTALVIAEHEHGTLRGATYNTVTAAAQCGGDVHVLDRAGGMGVRLAQGRSRRDLVADEVDAAAGAEAQKDVDR